MLARQLHDPLPELASGTVLPVTRPVAAFTLTDQLGQGFSNSRLAGTPHLLFFGFTHCPDICPTTLALMTQLARNPELAPLAMLFVTVDPLRDTQEVLRQYVDAFGGKVVSLRGAETDLEQLMKSLGAARSLTPRVGEDYAVDHSATLYYINRRGALAAVFTPPFEPGKLQGDLAALVKLDR
jgi:protein SCO1